MTLFWNSPLFFIIYAQLRRNQREHLEHKSWHLDFFFNLQLPLLVTAIWKGRFWGIPRLGPFNNFCPTKGVLLIYTPFFIHNIFKLTLLPLYTSIWLILPKPPDFNNGVLPHVNCQSCHSRPTITLARTPFFAHAHRHYALALTRHHRARVCVLARQSSIILYHRKHGRRTSTEAESV